MIQCINLRQVPVYRINAGYLCFNSANVKCIGPKMVKIKRLVLSL